MDSKLIIAAVRMLGCYRPIGSYPVNNFHFVHVVSDFEGSSRSTLRTVYLMGSVILRLGVTLGHWIAVASHE